MKHTVEPTSQGLRIDASVSPEKQGELLQELAKCAAGTCSCPTPQFGKLRSMDVKSEPTGVTVDLQVKAGEVIDIADVEKCLDHTAKHIGA